MTGQAKLTIFYFSVARNVSRVLGGFPGRVLKLHIASRTLGLTARFQRDSCWAQGRPRYWKYCERRPHPYHLPTTLGRYTQR